MNQTRTLKILERQKILESIEILERENKTKEIYLENNQSVRQIVRVGRNIGSSDCPYPLSWGSITETLHHLHFQIEKTLQKAHQNPGH